jgi:hypothetical protein
MSIKTTGTIEFKDIATPSAPASGTHIVYFKADGKAYYMGSDGVETALTGTVDSMDNILASQVFA